MSSLLEHKLSRQRHLGNNQTKDEPSKNLGPELSATFKDALVDVHVLMRPQDARKEAKERTGQGYEWRHNGKHDGNHHNEHVLGEDLVKLRPTRIIHCSHAGNDSSFRSKRGVWKENVSHGSLKERKDTRMNDFSWNEVVGAVGVDLPSL